MATRQDRGDGSEAQSAQGVIYVVATPIGNLEDISARAKRILAEVDIIAAEDTRKTLKLLGLLGIGGKRLVSYHDYNEETRSEALVAELQETGKRLALVSDAGTPCISDPGYRLVRAAKLAGVAVHPIPGPSALTAIVSAAGLASDRVLFIGFLPAKSGAIRSEAESWRGLGASIVFYEATRRLAKSLTIIAETHPGARVAIGRELTKLYEEIHTTSVEDALAWLATAPVLKGEATVMVELPRASAEAASPSAMTADALIDMATADFAAGASLRDLLVRYKDAGWKKPELYRLLLQAKDGGHEA